MTGKALTGRKTRQLSLTVLMAFGLAACGEDGGFTLGGERADSAGEDSVNRPARAQSRAGSQDTERPDLFEATDRGLWDGRPSLGGIWVAHPDVGEPQRVIIRNTENGQSVVGALFRRERENPGPVIQVSSDAAEELGMLAGAPSELSVVALEREEVEEPAPADENPVVADLAAPSDVEATPLDPVDGSAAAVDAASDGADAAADTSAAAIGAAATAAIAAADGENNTDADAPPPPPLELEAATPPPPAIPDDGTYIQIGIFSVEANANTAAENIRASDLPASVITQQAGGRSVWRLVVGPFEDEEERDAALETIKGLNYVDAFVVQTE